MGDLFPKLYPFYTRASHPAGIPGIGQRTGKLVGNVFQCLKSKFLHIPQMVFFQILAQEICSGEDKNSCDTGKKSSAFPKKVLRFVFHNSLHELPTGI